ncbi:MAG: ribosomal protein L7/L12 [Steroidobacteraceae bacterium]
MTSTHDLPSEVIDALRKGRKIEAIKLLRERHGVGLKEAKDMVEAGEGKAGPDFPMEEPKMETGIGRLFGLGILIVMLYVLYRTLA